MTQRVFAGITVSALDLSSLLTRVDDALARARRLSISFLNPDYARRALLSVDLRTDINAFDLVLVDGNGVRLLTPLFGFRVPQRLDADTVAPAVFQLLSDRSARLFLFGCGPGVAERAAARLATAYPGLQVVGTEHGFHDVQRGHPGRFDEADSRRIVAQINASRADMVLVSLPTPLQQRWVASYASQLDAAVVMAAGSYLDHLAESDRFPERWYPRWADALRLNWLYRLVREPRRLWRRYTVELAHFVALVVRARLRANSRAGFRA